MAKLNKTFKILGSGGNHRLEPKWLEPNGYGKTVLKLEREHDSQAAAASKTMLTLGWEHGEAASASTTLHLFQPEHDSEAAATQCLKLAREHEFNVAATSTTMREVRARAGLLGCDYFQIQSVHWPCPLS